MNLPDFNRAFSAGQAFRLDDREALVAVSEVGLLQLATGKLQVVDPLLYSSDGDAGEGAAAAAGPEEHEGTLDAARTSDDSTLRPSGHVPPGRYRVQRSDSHVPLAVRVVFVEEPAASWQAWPYSVGVDSGTMALADRSSLGSLSALDRETVVRAVKTLPAAGGVLDLPGSPVLAFSGLAPGPYSCFWGKAEDGRTVSLVIDLGGLWSEREVGLHIPLAELRPGLHANAALAAAGIVLEVVRCDGQELQLKIEGYDYASLWEVRAADGARMNQGNLFAREQGTLTLSAVDAFSDAAHLFVSIPSGGYVPMLPVDEPPRQESA